MVWLDGLSANEAYLVRIADDNSGNLADAITIKLIGLLKASVADDAFTASDALSVWIGYLASLADDAAVADDLVVARLAYLARLADDTGANPVDAVAIFLDSDFMWATLQPRSPSMVFTSRFPALVFAGRNPSITFTEVN